MKWIGYGYYSSNSGTSSTRTKSFRMKVTRVKVLNRSAPQVSPIDCIGKSQLTRMLENLKE